MSKRHLHVQLGWRNRSVKAILLLSFIGLMTIVAGCASTPPEDTRAQTTTQFLAQPRPAP
jgi:hypothetical protein